MHRRVLVTGGTGLTGMALQSLVNHYPGREFMFVGLSDCDLTKLDATIQFVERCAPDAIIHLAAGSGGIDLSMKYPATLLRDNVLMNMNILEAARIYKVKKTVMSLSVGMYPEHAPLPLREESIHDGWPHESNYSYAFAKRLIDPSIRAYRAEFGLNVIGLIPNGIFGEHGNFSTVGAVMVAALIRRFYENRASDAEIPVWGDGSAVREYTYAKDLARAYMWCLDNYDDAQVLNVGSTEEHSVREIAYLIAEIMGIDKGRVAWDTTKPGGISRRQTDNSRFVRLSDFQYTLFRIGLENTIRWFSENYGDPRLRR